MSWPTRTQQIGLLLLLFAMVAVAFYRAFPLP